MREMLAGSAVGHRRSAANCAATAPSTMLADTDGDLAHGRARERLERPTGGRFITEPGLKEAVQAKLQLEWSPEQIAAWLRTEYPDRQRNRTTAAEAEEARPRADAAVHRSRAADRPPAGGSLGTQSRRRLKGHLITRRALYASPATWPMQPITTSPSSSPAMPLKSLRRAPSLP
jgi:hypothetical protein